MPVYACFFSRYPLKSCFRFAGNFSSLRSFLRTTALKTINKSNIRTNNSFIYINISFILTNISLIYTFLRGGGNFVPRGWKISAVVEVFLLGADVTENTDATALLLKTNRVVL